MNPGRQAGRLRSCAGDDVDAAPWAEVEVLQAIFKMIVFKNPF